MKSFRILTAAALAALAAFTAHAATHVAVDTSGLLANPAGPYSIDFQFNDGTGAHDNQVVLSNFNFGGGSVTGSAFAFGGVTGDLLAGITLTDSEPFNEFFQEFNPGTWFSFDLTITGIFTGGVPDVFAFSILDANLFNLGTYAPGSDQFLIAAIDGPTPSFAVYASVDGAVPAPVVTTASVPDATGTFALVAVTIGGLVLVRRRVLRRPEPAAT